MTTDDDFILQERVRLNLDVDILDEGDACMQ